VAAERGLVERSLRWLFAQAARPFARGARLRLTVHVVFLATIAIVLGLAAYVSHSLMDERSARVQSELRTVSEVVSRELQGVQGAAILMNMPIHAASSRTTAPIVYPEYFFRYFFRDDDKRRQVVPRPVWAPNPSMCVRPALRGAESQSGQDQLTICSAVVPNASYGQYVFLAIVLRAGPPRQSDAETLRDHLVLRIGGEQGRTVVLAFSGAAASFPGAAIYDMLAYEMTDEGRSRVRGWVNGQAFFEQPEYSLQPRERAGRQEGRVTVLIRVEAAQISPELKSRDWPPARESLAKLSTTVTVNIAAANGTPYSIAYTDHGESLLSLPMLSGTGTSVRLSLLERDREGVHPIWESHQEAQVSEGWFERFGRAFRVHVLRAAPLQRSVAKKIPISSAGGYVMSAESNLPKELQDVDRVAALFAVTVVLLIVAYALIYLRVVRRLQVLYRLVRRWKYDGVDPKAPNIAPAWRKALSSSDELGQVTSEFTELVTEKISEANARSRRAWQEQQRTEGRRRVLRAIGHEIRAPLQAIVSLIGPGHSAHPYLKRMRRAVDDLFGANSVVEAFDTRKALHRSGNLSDFCAQMAESATHLGFPGVRFEESASPIFAEFDAELLEDAVTAILDNASQMRAPGSPILLTLGADAEHALLSIVNHGSYIEDRNLVRVFDYNFSTRERGTGQGLFVAMTAITKQGGRLSAANLPDGSGVAFVIELPLTSGPSPARMLSDAGATMKVR
jgi:signal transduction histidine kinase